METRALAILQLTNQFLQECKAVTCLGYAMLLNPQTCGSIARRSTILGYINGVIYVDARSSVLSSLLIRAAGAEQRDKAATGAAWNMWHFQA